MDSNWTSTNFTLPQEGYVVETKISDANGERNFANLIRERNLWWHEDKTMYVYYTPTHWRYAK